MFIPFEDLQPKARVWVYQSDRKFTNEERNFILSTGQEFVSNWTAHNNALKSSINIFYDHFIVLAVDEDFAAATGCSIDKSFHFIQALEGKLNISLLDKSNIAFFINEEVKLIKLTAIKSLIEKNEINPEDLVFNNLVMDKSSLDRDWLIAAKDSWMGRFFMAKV